MFKSMIMAAGLVGVLFLQGTANADPVGGPLYSVDRCQAYSTVTYNVQVWGGETTAIRIRGDGDTDLDVFVYDEFGRLLTSGESYSDRETVFVTPARTQNLRIVVSNLGSVYNEYRIDVW